MELTGRRALVTGAGKGIGRAVARALAREGVAVGLLSRTREDLEQVAAELREDGAGSAIAVADIGVRAEAEAAVEQIAGELGGVDILVNNAAVAAFGTILDMDPEEWERIVRINLFGSYYVTRAVLPGMIEQRRGDIINVSSTAGEKGAAGTSAYSASKAGLLRFNEALTQEARKHDIRVMALLPSTVNTGMAAGVGLKIGPEDRMLQSEDVADLVVATLRLPQRAFVRDVSILTTNPV